MNYVQKQYEKFIEKNGYIPQMFNPYNSKEIVDFSPTQTTICGSVTSSSTVLINMNENEFISKGGFMKEFKNESLKRYEYSMDEIRIFDVFAGKGALHRSLYHLGVPIRITNLSEVDVDAIISYAAIHIEGFKDIEFEYPTMPKMKEWLMDRKIGWDFVKNKSSIPRMKQSKVELVYKASVLLNNLGDISSVNYDDIEDFDLMNFSFCCQDISNAGKQKGLKNEDGTPTRSGLVVYGLEAIRHKQPKFVMIENVKGLIQKKFISDFYDIINELNDIGYKCYYPTKEDKKGELVPCCLNAKNYGIPQNRERIYVICVRNDIELGMKFPEGFDCGVRLRDFLEDEVDEKYYLSQAIQDGFKLNGKIDEDRNELNIVDRLDSSGFTICERRCDEGIRFFKDNICGSLRTIDSCGDKRIIESCNDLKIRKLTPKECWRLMGFTDDCFNRAKELGISDGKLWKQAGNSIVVNVLYYIFKELFESYRIKTIN